MGTTARTKKPRTFHVDHLPRNNSISAEELAQFLSKDITQIYRLAHRLKWRRKNNRPVRYLIEDVIQTIDKLPVNTT